MTKTKREDGRGHWPAGKQRSTVDPDRARKCLAALARILDTRGDAGGPNAEISRKAVARYLGVDDRTIRKWLRVFLCPQTQSGLAGSRPGSRASLGV
jgi:hypothetical protein